MPHSALSDGVALVAMYWWRCGKLVEKRSGSVPSLQDTTAELVWSCWVSKSGAVAGDEMFCLQVGQRQSEERDTLDRQTCGLASRRGVPSIEGSVDPSPSPLALPRRLGSWVLSWVHSDSTKVFLS